MILIVVVAAILGVAAYYSLLPAVFCMVAYLAILFFFHSTRKYIPLAVIVLLFYSFITFLHANLQHSQLDGDETEIVVRFTDLPEIEGSSFRAFVKTVEGETLLLRYTFSEESEKSRLLEYFQLGLTCKVMGQLERPMAARNPNSFDYQVYLHNLNIHWVIKSSSNPLAMCKNTNPNWIEHIKSIRMHGLKYLEEHFPPEAQAFAAALLFGESGWIEEGTYDAYKKLSLVHILAISGLHVSIIAGGIFFLSIRIGLTRESARILMLCMLPLYCIIAGGAPSVVRACLMVMAFMMLSFGKMKLSPVVVLCTVFLLLLLYNPLYLFHVGFQLSFFITFALLMSVNLLNHIHNSSKIVQALAVTVICQLCSMPIILYYFHEFSLWGFLLNVIYIPIYTIVLLPLTFAAFFLSIINTPFSSVFTAFLELLFTLVNKVAVFVSDLPYTSLSLGKPSLWFILLLVMLIISIFSFWESGYKRKLVYSVCASFLLLALFYHKVQLSPFGEVVFIDVGQGDSILIKRPYGRGVYLIDTGGLMTFPQEEWQKKRKTFEPGEDIVVPYLKSIGIRKLDKLILTHDDTDHIGGGLALLEHIEVKEIVISETLKEEFAQQALIQKALKENVHISVMRAGDGWRKGDDTFYILHPDTKMSDSNENSLVLLASINGLKWLFTGDIGEEGERALLERFPRLKVDVLKAGHHGSKTSSSSSFLQQIDAKVAVVSAGYSNRYGHPHPQVLSAFEEQQMVIFRTDEQGAITYSYFGRRGTFSSMLP